jgi:hypothetical protein
MGVHSLGFTSNEEMPWPVALQEVDDITDLLPVDPKMEVKADEGVPDPSLGQSDHAGPCAEADHVGMLVKDTNDDYYWQRIDDGGTTYYVPCKSNGEELD